ncbi:MAG TPA: choice-of-anchor tandem repeat NxxGxxAF-containing protein [Blastocatellia bacterium]|nr:choice-of-anchor tandem repeat NxxGxxAF-containing protein [Blastocatellia bacterium]
MNGRYAIKFMMALGMFLGCILVPSSSVLAQSGAFTISPVVKRGDSRADGGTFFDCDFCNVRIAGDHGLNDLGQVVISGFAGNCGVGVYVVSNRTGFRVADVCHPTSFGRLSLFAGANINNRGQVVLNMGPAINNTIVDMILLYSDGQLTKIAAEGDQSPIGTVLGGSCGLGPPSINNNGEVAFFACSNPDDEGRVFNGVLGFSGGTLHKVIKSGDASPLGGLISLAFGNAEPVHINDNGDVLFGAGQLDPDITVQERFGLFLATADGIRKVELGRDIMPNGSKAADNSIGGGTLNNKGDVVFGLRLSGKPQVGYFLYSGGQLSTIIVDGQPSPIGGKFDLLQEIEDPGGPRINDNGTVALMANVTGDNSTEAIFLASPKAIVKVVAVGDRLPTGEKIRNINTFALNNLGQVAFFANGDRSFFNPRPLGVYLATPLAPEITSVKLKRKKGALELRVNGNAMITNDTVIEINGVALEQLSYPADFQENGGTTTRVVSRDSRLEQLIQSGSSVQVTVFNPLTNLRSGAKTFTR